MKKLIKKKNFLFLKIENKENIIKKTFIKKKNFYVKKETKKQKKWTD